MKEIKLYKLSYEDGEYCVGTEAEVIKSHNEWVEQSGRFELDEIDDNLASTLKDLEEHWTVEQFYTITLDKDSDNLTEIIQQLWECLSRGYTYQEAKIHMKAFKDGKTTRKRLVVEEVV